MAISGEKILNTDEQIPPSSELICPLEVFQNRRGGADVSGPRSPFDDFSRFLARNRHIHASVLSDPRVEMAGIEMEF